jgi:hypothetical protein
VAITGLIQVIRSSILELVEYIEEIKDLWDSPTLYHDFMDTQNVGCMGGSLSLVSMAIRPFPVVVICTRLMMHCASYAKKISPFIEFTVMGGVSCWKIKKSL